MCWNESRSTHQDKDAIKQKIQSIINPQNLWVYDQCLWEPIKK